MKPLESKEDSSILPVWRSKPTLLEAYIKLAAKPSVLRRALKTGWLAFKYGLRLTSPTIRNAQLDEYQLAVNIAEPLGICAYFFSDPCVPSFLDKLIRSEDSCFDIGSNMGHYSGFVASRVGTRGRVVIFEPQPFYARLISTSIRANKWEDRCTLVEKAAAASSGQQIKFYLSTNTHNSGVASLVNHGTWLEESHSIAVETITLDDWAAANQIERVRFAKIDVERAEDLVLQGAGRLLSRQAIDVLWIELVTGAPAATILQDADYVGFSLPDRSGAAVSINKIPDGLTADLLFFPRARTEEFAWILETSVQR